MTKAESIPNQIKKKFVIIDGKSVFYRGYYAMPNLTTKDGTPTGGVYGFATLALEIIKRLKPDYVAVAWDKPKTNIRKRLAIYSEYKAGRKPPPPDFYDQIPVLHELLEAFGWPLYELDDYEADDIMGTLGVQAAKQGIDTLLVTSDLDMLQLIDPHVKVFALKKGLTNIELYTPESFTAKYGIRVDQFLDLKSLKGDSSDNIPGVPGIGEKGAIELLKQYETLDGIYENLALLKDSMRKKLEAGKDSAYMSKQLGAIWCDAPLMLNLEEVDGRKVNPEVIRDLLQKLEFRSLVRQLPEVMQHADIATATVPTSQSMALPTPKQLIINNAEKLAGIDFSKTKEAVVYSRCAGRHGRDPRYVFVSPDPKTLYTFEVARLNRDVLATKLGQLQSLVGYDVKSTLKVFIDLGLIQKNQLPPVSHDVVIGAFVLNALRREQSLTELAQADLGYDGSPLENLDDDDLLHRAPEIIAIIRALHVEQAAALKDVPKFTELVADVEWPVIPVLARMEYQGIGLDTHYLANFAVEINKTIAELERQIYEQAGEEFNIGSPSQLAGILFETLDLPKKGIKKGKTGYSTAASELDKLRGQHAIIDLITQYREVAKLKNTYVDTLPKLVDDDSRVHTTFNLTNAQTGRLSSLDPNLQNIPTRTDLGRRVRTAFVAGKSPDGKPMKLISADYSQFELRLAAAMSGDEGMITLFNSGTDIHTATAAQIQGRELEDVTKTMRSAAKTVNFGVLYGMSPHGLSAATGMSFEQSKHFIDEYFKVRGPLLAYLNSLKEFAHSEGYVETLHGRRRPMPDIQSSNYMVRQGAERAAMNMPIQGTEADLMKLAMINVEKELEDKYPDTKMLLQIHDSILVETPEADAQAVAKLLRTIMEAVYPELPVQLTVDTKIGDNWGEL